MRTPWRIAAVTAFSLTVLTGALVGDRVLAVNEETRNNLSAFTELVTVVHEQYGAEVEYKDVVFASIQGMLRTLDPHTSFLPPNAYRRMREKQQESFYGLGILVGARNGRLTVITPIEGTPASRLGLRAGDVIDTIEGEPTEPMNVDEAVEKLKGPKGTQVTVTILRRGMDEPLEMTITRAEIPQTTVRHSYMLTPDTGYVWVTDFARGTGAEVGEAIEELRQEGMKRLLLDLRNNGGGLLDQAIEVADYFLPDDAPIVETRGRTRDSVAEYQDTGSHEPVDLPVVVLVNEGTASAAEIVSGAIQDHDMGLIVGMPTWGKGLVQTVYNLPYGAGLALTTARYYTPSGRLIQRDYSSFYDYYTYRPHMDEEGGENGGAADGESAEDDAATGAHDGPVFYTDLGREVYGGGGIAPDVVVEPEELSSYSQLLVSRNAHFDFAVDWVRRNGVEAASWDPSWRPGDEVLEDFGDWLVSQEISTPEEAEEGLADPVTADDALMRIRAEVFNALWGQDASHRVRAEGDAQIQRAMDLFDRAEDLLARRRAVDEAEDNRIAEKSRADTSEEASNP
ncbi:MAG: S41 family peptidase [bacterium]